MTIFAADSSSAACSAAILRDGVVLAESYANVGLTHSETFMVVCDEVFRRAALRPADMDYFSITCGPGSFTGLRIGMGAVKGMAFAVSKPCVAVPTLEALAWGCAGNARDVVATCDARQRRVFAAVYGVAGAVRELSPARVLPVDGLEALCAGKPVLFAGDAARLCYDALKGRMDCAVAPPAQQYVRASNVAAAALARIERGLFCDAAGLAPDYLQPSQAERNRKERIEDGQSDH